MIQLEFFSTRQRPFDKSYQIARQFVRSNRPVPYLDSFRHPADSAEMLPGTIPNLADQRFLEMKQVKAGWLANRYRSFRLVDTTSGSYLSISGLGRFFIDQSGQMIAQLPPPTHVRISQIAECVIGPCLILSLARLDTWCFHASAVQINGKLVVFLGGSGFGKSTLAAYFDTPELDVSTRFIDDILPVAVMDGRHQALLHYPQLKLPPENQPSLIAPESMLVSAIYILSSPAAPSQTVEIQPLSTPQGMINLIQFTVASRLFNRQQLISQFDFCSNAAQQVPIHQLNYPWGLNYLPWIRDSILNDLDTF